MKIKKNVNSATNSCGIPAKPSMDIEESTNGRYLYLTKHGIGPGTLPKDVKLLNSKELSPYITAIWVNRFLTTEELSDYDIYPETGMDDVLEKNGIDETVESLQAITSATYDDSEHQVSADYIAQLIENVDGKLPDTFVTYRYELGDNMITCTSASPKQIAEYDVPVSDLSGELEEDTEYILGAIEDEEVDFGEDLVLDGRYTFIDSKTVLDFDGTITDYAMYYDEDEDKYVFVFGDMELYSPYDENFDWECETEREAWEWFESYEGPGSEEEDEYSEFHDFSDWYY